MAEALKLYRQVSTSRRRLKGSRDQGDEALTASLSLACSRCYRN